MRDLLIILDSVRYDRFLEADAPELKSLGPVYKACSHGTWTRPSVVSLLSGYLPQSEAGQPYKPSWVMLSPEVFHERQVKSYFLNANAWVHNMQPRRYIEKWYPEPYSAPRMVEDARQIMESNSEFFVALLIVETHCPYDYEPSRSSKEVVEIFKAYNEGEDNDAPRIARERQRKAISHVSKLLKPLLDIPDRIIVTADHGDLQGENHKIGHDPTFKFHIKLLEVPLIVSTANGKQKQEMDFNPISIEEGIKQLIRYFTLPTRPCGRSSPWHLRSCS